MFLVLMLNKITTYTFEVFLCTWQGRHGKLYKWLFSKNVQQSICRMFVFNLAVADFVLSKVCCYILKKSYFFTIGSVWL